MSHERLIVMEHLMSIEDMLYYKKQGQVTSYNIQEVETLLCAIHGMRKNLPENTYFDMSLMSLIEAIREFLETGKSMLVDSLKKGFEKHLTVLLSECASEIREYYSNNHFEPSEEITKIMRHAVKINVEENGYVKG